MRVFVTGATGFVGGNLVHGLCEQGMNVGCLLRTSSKSEMIDCRAVILRHDGTTEQLYEQMAAFKPEVVVHAATYFVGAHEPSDIRPLIESNIVFGAQLLDAMARMGVRKLVNLGTSWQHFDGDAYNPANLYAATKQSFEDIAEYYVQSEKFSILNLKLSDTYGSGDQRNKLISNLIKAAKLEQILDMSAGEQRLNFIHIDDVVVAIASAMRRIMVSPEGTKESFALRGSQTLSLRQFVSLFERATQWRVAVAWGARPYRPREVMQPWLGPLLPDWEARIPLFDGLRALRDSLPNV